MLTRPPPSRLQLGEALRSGAARAGENAAPAMGPLEQLSRLVREEDARRGDDDPGEIGEGKCFGAEDSLWGVGKRGDRAERTVFGARECARLARRLRGARPRLRGARRLRGSASTRPRAACPENAPPLHTDDNMREVGRAQRARCARRVDEKRT